MTVESPIRLWGNGIFHCGRLVTLCYWAQQSKVAERVLKAQFQTFQPMHTYHFLIMVYCFLCCGLFIDSFTVKKTSSASTSSSTHTHWARFICSCSISKCPQIVCIHATCLLPLVALESTVFTTTRDPTMAETASPSCTLRWHIKKGKMMVIPINLRDLDNSYRRQLVPRTAHTQDNSYPCGMI